MGSRSLWNQPTKAVKYINTGALSWGWGRKVLEAKDDRVEYELDGEFKSNWGYAEGTNGKEKR